MKHKLINCLILIFIVFESKAQINKVDVKVFLETNISKKEYKIEQLENEISNNSSDHSLLLNKAVRLKIFFDAQDYSTEFYDKNCKDLGSQIKLYNKLLKDKFINGLETSNFLVQVAKKKDFNFDSEYQTLVNKFKNEYSSFLNFSEENCYSVLQELMRRKDGQINGVNNKNLFSLNYLLNPVEEIFNNDYHIFSTINNQSESDFFLTLHIPKSWEIKDKQDFSYSTTIGYFEPYEKFLNSSISISSYPNEIMSKEEMNKNKITDEILLNEIYSDIETLSTIITSFNKELRDKKINCTFYNNGNLKYILYIAEGDLGNITQNSILDGTKFKSLNAITIKNGSILKFGFGSGYKENEFNSYDYYSKLFFKILMSVKLKKVQSNTIYLTEKENMKFLNVFISDKSYEFMLDTGASNILINKRILNEFLISGYIEKNNFISESKATLADGTEIITENWLLPEIKIKNKTIKNVIVSVVDNENSMLLFGMDGLKKLNVEKLNLNDNEILIKQ